MIPSVFLSYAREDKVAVEQLSNRLSRSGFRPWLDIQSIAGGERWKQAIDTAVESTDFFIACTSKRSINKRGENVKEIRLALEKARGMLDTDIYLIVLRLDDCETHELLHAHQWINYFEPSGWDRLLEALHLGMHRRFNTPISDPQLIEPMSLLDVEVQMSTQSPRPGGTRIIYKGAGPGTFWHKTDARLSGYFEAPSRGARITPNAMANLINIADRRSALLSFTTRFATAKDYAILGPGGIASQMRPGFVYEVEVQEDSLEYRLLDPFKEISTVLPGPFDPGHHLFETAAGSVHKIFSNDAVDSSQMYTYPIRAMLYALRDAELHVAGRLPSSRIVNRHSVW